MDLTAIAVVASSEHDGGHSVEVGLVDLASFTLLSDADRGDSRPGIGTALYLLGSPLVHAIHGNSDRMWKSLGLHFVPAILSVAALATSGMSGSGEYREFQPSPLFFVAAFAVPIVTVVDAVFLGFDDPPPSSASALSRLTVSPFVARRGAGGGLSVRLDL